MASVAIPLDDDFEDSEFIVPYDRLTEAGHRVTVIGTESGKALVGKRHQATVTVESAAGDVEPEDFDAVVIPGGYSPDHLRVDRDVVEFVRRAVESGMPVAAVCHGPQLLIEADVVAGRRMTSWPSVRTDLENAGAKWVDQEVVEDANLITSRRPEDLQSFSDAILKRLEHAER
jgi:protease I